MCGWIGRLRRLTDSRRISKPTEELAQLVDSLPWKTVTSRPFTQIHRVNIQEVRALAHEQKRLATRRDLIGMQRVCASDSMVALGAWGKRA